MFLECVFRGGYSVYYSSTLITSRLRRFFHRDSGKRDRVTNCSSNCSGESYFIISSLGSMVSSDNSTSENKNLRVTKINTEKYFYHVKEI